MKTQRKRGQEETGRERDMKRQRERSKRWMVGSEREEDRKQRNEKQERVRGRGRWKNS